MRTGGYTGIERKFLDSGLSFTLFTAPSDASGGEHDPATVNCLNAIAQGDGESNRDGRKCVMKNVYITGAIHWPVQSNSSAPLAAVELFIALVLDTQTNGAQLNSEDVYVNPMGTIFGAASPLRNLQFTSRFKVLDSFNTHMDTPNFAFHATNDFDTGGRDITFKLSKTLDIPVSFTGTTGNVSTIQDNSLHIVAFVTATTPGVGFSYNSRVRFVSP